MEAELTKRRVALPEQPTVAGLRHDIDTLAARKVVHGRFRAAQLKPNDDRREELQFRVDRYGVTERYGIIIVR
jgi:hypothetical protein